MEKISAEKAFEILVKDDKADLLKMLGKQQFGNIKHSFLHQVDAQVDVNDQKIKDAYQYAINDGVY